MRATSLHSAFDRPAFGGGGGVDVRFALSFTPVVAEFLILGPGSGSKSRNWFRRCGTI